MCLIFSYFSTVFEKLANISQQELSLKHILKECLISKDLQIIRKKQAPFWSTLIRVAPLKILKRYCSAFGTWSSPSTTRYKHLTKQGCNYKRNWFNFSSRIWYIIIIIIIIWPFTCLIFWSRSYQINDRKQPFTTVPEI